MSIGVLLFLRYRPFHRLSSLKSLHHHPFKQCHYLLIPSSPHNLRSIDRWFDLKVCSVGWNNKSRTRSGDHLSLYLVPCVFSRQCDNNNSDDHSGSWKERDAFSHPRNKLKPVSCVLLIGQEEGMMKQEGCYRVRAVLERGNYVLNTIDRSDIGFAWCR